MSSWECDDYLFHTFNGWEISGYLPADWDDHYYAVEDWGTHYTMSRPYFKPKMEGWFVFYLPFTYQGKPVIVD